MSAVIPLQNGLDVQHTADHCRRTGDSPALAEIFQVVHRKVLAHIGAHGVKHLADRFKVLAPLDHLCRPQHHKPLAQRGCISIKGQDLPLRILLLHFPGSNGRYAGGTADTAGHSHIYYIIPGLQLRHKGLVEFAHADQAGLYIGAGTHGVVKGRAVKIRLRGILGRDAIHRVLEGYYLDFILVNQLYGQIGGSVSKKLDHSNFSFACGACTAQYLGHPYHKPASEKSQTTKRERALLPMKESHLLVESDSTESRTVKNALFFPKKWRKNHQKSSEKFRKDGQKVHKNSNKGFTIQYR